MAIDNRLKVFDEQGNPVDYDILASDVKFMPDGKDLPTKLAEMEDEIGEGGYTPPAGGIPKTDLAPSVQQTLDDVADKVDKVPGKGLSTNDYTTDDKTKLGNLPTADQLTQQMNSKANDNAVVKSISVNGGTSQTPTNGNVNIEVQAGEQVSVIQPATPDGTFTIRVGSTDYTINLNHTHEGMVKLEKVTAATLPDVSEMADDTIYVQVDNLTTPTEIVALHIFGLEFAGGVPDTGMPQVTNPSPARPLNLGTNDGSGVTALVDVKARNLKYNGSTDGLTVSVGQNSGLLLSYGQTSDATSITIPQLDAETGCQITVKYTGSGALNDGALVFSHDNAVLSSVVVVVVVPVPTTLTAIKMTGTQWLQTDYCPNEDTEFELDTKITGFPTGQNSSIVFDCEMNTGEDSSHRKLFRSYATVDLLYFANEESVSNPPGSSNRQAVAFTPVNSQRGIIKYVKGTTNGTFSCGSNDVATSLKSSTMQHGLRIGYGRSTNAGADDIASFTEFIIYGFKITEGGTIVRNYVPRIVNGVPGLLDISTNGSHEFISSETSTPVVEIE